MIGIAQTFWSHSYGKFWRWRKCKEWRRDWARFSSRAGI